MRAKGVLPTLIAYVLWGLLPIYWKLLQVIPPDRIIALRIVWSFVFVTILLVVGRGLPRFLAAVKTRRQMAYLGLAAVLITINWFTYIYAVNNGMMVESSLGYYINPLVSILLGVLFFKERFRPAQVVAILLAVAGVAVMVVEVGKVPWVGLVLAVSFGVYGLIKKKVSVDATVGLAVETAVLSPFALLYLLLTPTAGLLAASTLHDGVLRPDCGLPAAVRGDPAERHPHGDAAAPVRLRLQAPRPVDDGVPAVHRADPDAAPRRLRLRRVVHRRARRLLRTDLDGHCALHGLEPQGAPRRREGGGGGIGA